MSGKRMPGPAAAASLADGGLPGDLSALAEQVGSTQALAALAVPVWGPGLGKSTSPTPLQRFLEQHHRHLLIPVELPVIQRAYWHSHRYEIRELIALDQRLAWEPALESFAAASRRLGRSQVRRLRPLRDHRVAQRYVAAVECGRAHGWHTVVYGLVLAVYGLPLRQGLLHYGHQTVRGFISAAARSLTVSQAQGEELLLTLSAGLPAAVERVLDAAGTRPFAAGA